MAASLPLDIHQHIAQNTTCLKTLFSLTLVCKTFNRIYTPALYTHIYIWDHNHTSNALTSLSNLPIATHLRHTRSLEMRKSYPRDGESLLQCFRAMQNLESLVIAHCFMVDLDFSEHSHRRGRIQPILQHLSDSKVFHALHLESEDFCGEFSVLLPRFTHLRSLSLNGIEHGGSDTENLVDVLVASAQHLHALSLSEEFEVHGRSEGPSLIYDLCAKFHLRRMRDLDIPRLRLKKLALGVAFQPRADMAADYDNGSEDYDSDPDESAEEKAERKEYPNCIAKLTDLSLLEELELENSIRKGWHNFNERRIPVEDWSLFAEATSLRRFKIQRITRGVLDFISSIRLANSEALTEIAGLGDDDNSTGDVGETNEIYKIVEKEPMFAYPMQKIAELGGWKKVELAMNWSRYGGAVGFPTVPWQYEAFCKGNEIEELACVFEDGEFKKFKTEALPYMTKLKRLVLSMGKQKQYGQTMGWVSTEDSNEEERILMVNDLFDVSMKAWQARGYLGRRLQVVEAAGYVYTSVHDVEGRVRRSRGMATKVVIERKRR